MTDKEKYLLLAAVAAVGVGYWWYSNHQTAATQIVSQPSVPVSALPNVSAPLAAGQSAIAPVGTSTTLTGQDATELNALLSWSTQTKNPPLYQQMINALTPTQLDGLYNILTTQWDTGNKPTVSQTAFWNTLRQQYPFLNSAGQGCTNLQCN